MQFAMQKLYMIFRKCQGSAFDVIDTRQKKIATILSVFLLEGYFRSTFHEKLSQIQEKKSLFSFFFFFAVKDSILMQAFIIIIYFHRKKVANSKSLSL